jgi:hypothetical protein
MLNGWVSQPWLFGGMFRNLIEDTLKNNLQMNPQDKMLFKIAYVEKKTCF